MSWNKSLSELQLRLAQLYPLKEDILPLAVKAGLSASQLTVSDKGILFWYHVLTEARLQGKLDELLHEARQSFPDDAQLASINAALIDQDDEVRPEILKTLCAEIIRDGELDQALPLVQEIMSRSPQAATLDEEMVKAFARANRHLRDADQRSGRKKARSLRHMETSKTDLIALVQAL